MKNLKKSLFTLLLLAVLSSCEDTNISNLFYTPCDVDHRFEQSIAYNQAHPTCTLQVDNDNYAFWITSDLHIKESTPPYVEQFLKNAGKDSAQFIVYNGDIYHGQEAYATYASQVLHSQSPLPAFYVAGNHDLYFGWDIYQNNFGSSTYTAIIQTPAGNDLLIMLESASATLGNSQYKWLQEQLKQRGNYRHCFVFTHTNLQYQHITNGVFMADEAHVLYRLFSDNKVSAVFTGHSHVENQQTLLGVQYITTGSLKNGQLGMVNVTDNEVRVEFKHL